MIEPGTPIWSNGFGCVTWVRGPFAGVALLAGGEPKVEGIVTVEQAEYWARLWKLTCQEDGRIETVV